MVYTALHISILLLVFSVFLKQIVCADDECIVSFSEDVTGCKDFDNDVVESNLELVEMDYLVMGLNGSMTLQKDLTEGTMVELKISKITSSGPEALFLARADLCQSVKEDDVPWKPLIEQMHVSSCPITMGTYTIIEMVPELEGLKESCTSDYAGSYKVEMMLKDGQMNDLSCHEFDMDIELIRN